MARFFQNPGVRDQAFFGFDWQFSLTDNACMPSPDAQWRTVQLPHDWSAEYPVSEDAPSCGSGGYARTGIGWYRRRFSVKRGPADRIALYFEGVYMNCDVWLNGIHVGGHVYGYTSFEMDITDVLTDGENTLLVRVDNSRQPGSRWYTGSGITRNVYLLRTGKTRIRTWGVCITTPKISNESALVCVQTDVCGAFGLEDVQVETSLLDASGQVCAQDLRGVAAKDAACATQTLRIHRPTRWDVETPALYTAISRLYVAGTLVDEVHTRFGIREIAYDAQNGFMLNGRKLIQRGVCLHHDGGCVGAAVPPAIWRRRLKKLREMGANALRFSHNPPDPALLDMADEMGFVVMDEAFDEWHAMKGKEFGSNTHESRGYSEWFDACWQADLAAMIRRDRNHPSVVMWSIGNEVHEQSLEGGWRIAHALAGLCHALDPTRPITQACDQVKAEPSPADVRFLETLDVVGVNYTDRWRERTETFFDEEKREHPDWLLLGTEDIAVNGPRGDYRLVTEDSVWGRTPYYARMLKAEKLWKFIRTRPYVIGSYMWTGVDYLGECFWPNKSYTAGVLDTCGFEKDGYYFYQSIWRKDRPVLFICPHLNLDVKAGTIIPVIAYTNCHTVELFVDGVSYGVKAYEFPAVGMTQRWAHFDQPPAPITTNDLHLSWDIPYTHGEIIAVGRDAAGSEIARASVRHANRPEKLCVRADRLQLRADGRDVAQLEIELRDAQDTLVPDNDLPVQIHVQGGELLGMDNGRSDDHALYACGQRNTFRGLAYAVVRAPRAPGMVQIEITAPDLPPVSLALRAE